MAAKRIEPVQQWWKQRAFAKLAVPTWMKELLCNSQPILLALEQKIRALTAQLQSAADPQQPRGLGAMSSVVIDREIGNWRRFNNRRQVGTYTGLCLGEHGSGNTRQQSCVTKHGNPRLRAALVETAWRLIRFQPNYKPIVKWREIVRKGALATGAARKNCAAESNRCAPEIFLTFPRHLVSIGPVGKARVAKEICLYGLRYSGKILLLLAAAIVCAVSQSSAGQIFVVNTFGNTVGEYTTSGTTIDPTLISGLSSPQGVAISGGHLFITNAGGNTIGEYDARTGAMINPALISGLHDPSGIAIIGNNLFVANSGNGTIGKYTTAGATIDPALISHLSDPLGIAFSGNNLFITNARDNFVGKYTLSGETVDPTFIGGFTLALAIAASGGYVYISDPEDNSIRKFTTSSGSEVEPFGLAPVGAPVGIAVFGGSLFVTYTDRSGVIGEYEANTGLAINSTLVSGLSGPTGIAVVSASSVPDAGATLALLLVGLTASSALRPVLLRRV